MLDIAHKNMTNRKSRVYCGESNRRSKSQPRLINLPLDSVVGIDCDQWIVDLPGGRDWLVSDT
jgi:hypothetical protein